MPPQLSRRNVLAALAGGGTAAQQCAGRAAAAPASGDGCELAVSHLPVDQTPPGLLTHTAAAAPAADQLEGGEILGLVAQLDEGAGLKQFQHRRTGAGADPLGRWRVLAGEAIVSSPGGTTRFGGRGHGGHNGLAPSSGALARRGRSLGFCSVSAVVR